MVVENAGGSPIEKPTSIVSELTTALWAGRRLVVAGTAFCVLVGVVVSLVLPTVYESQATLLLLPSAVKEVLADAKQGRAGQVGLFPKQLSVPDFVPLLKSGALLERIVAKVGAKYPEEIASRLSTVDRLATQLQITTQVTEKTVNRTEYSPVIVLTARADSAELAQFLAEAWAEQAVESGPEFYMRKDVTLSGFLGNELERTRTAFDDVITKQRTVETAWDEASSRKRIEEKALSLTKLEDERARAYSDMQAARKEAEKYSAALAQEKPTIVLWKSPPAESIFLEGVLSDKKQPEKGPDTNAGYHEEVLNETYVYLQEQLSDAQAQLGSLEERERALRESVSQTNKELEALRAENARYSYEAKLLKPQAEAFSTRFGLLSDVLEQAKVADSVTKDLADLRVVGPAVLPERRVAPRRSAIVAAAAVLGFAASIVATLLMHRLKMGFRVTAEG